MLDIPARATTMIGSMPGVSPGDVDSILSAHPLTIPSWCQLPGRSAKEAMIPQYSEGFPCVEFDQEKSRFYVDLSDGALDQITEFYERYLASDLDAFAISADYAEGLHHYLAGLRDRTSKIPIAKGQVTGPITFGLGLSDQEGRSVWFNREYREVVLKGLTMKVLWQINELRKHAENVLIFLDEPILSALGTPTYMSIQDADVVSALDEIIDAAHGAGATIGVHCCGNMDWGLLAQTKVDIMAFDAYFYGEKVGLYAEAINALLEDGRYLAWGIVPTTGHTVGEFPANDETAGSLEQRLQDLLSIFVDKGMSQRRLERQMILTPSCGLGSLSHNDSATVLKLLHELS